jgi:cyclopropane fatty-acyl-phospholipid synthase-like methyltransferase
MYHGPTEEDLMRAIRQVSGGGDGGGGVAVTLAPTLNATFGGATLSEAQVREILRLFEAWLLREGRRAVQMAARP